MQIKWLNGRLTFAGENSKEWDVLKAIYNAYGSESDEMFSQHESRVRSSHFVDSVDTSQILAVTNHGNDQSVSS